MRILPLFIVFIFYSCEKHSSGQKEVTPVQKEFIALDLSDENYRDLYDYARDSVTSLGWSIRYLVKNDSTQYTDLYIECEKSNVKKRFRAENVLEYRRYFIPQFSHETENNLYFTHGCATDCSAVLVFSKKRNAFVDYEKVVAVDFSLEQVLIVNYSDSFSLTLFDLIQNREHTLNYDGVCMGVNPQNCIEKVVFGKKRTVVKASISNPQKPELVKTVLRNIDL